MNSKRIAVGGLVAGACALAGTLGGIASSTAAKSNSSTRIHATASTGTTGAGGPAGFPGGPGRGFGPGGGPGGDIHSVSVELNQARTGYVTVTEDGGTIQSVDTGAGTLTVVEGLSSSPYKTVTLTIPSAATIQLDGKSSTLSALASGDHVEVRSSSDGTTTVFATDSSFTPAGHGGPGDWHGGPPSQTTTTTTSTTSTAS